MSTPSRLPASRRAESGPSSTNGDSKANSRLRQPNALTATRSRQEVDTAATSRTGTSSMQPPSMLTRSQSVRKPVTSTMRTLSSTSAHHGGRTGIEDSQSASGPAASTASSLSSSRRSASVRNASSSGSPSSTGRNQGSGSSRLGASISTERPGTRDSLPKRSGSLLSKAGSVPGANRVAQHGRTLSASSVSQTAEKAAPVDGSTSKIAPRSNPLGRSMLSTESRLPAGNQRPVFSTLQHHYSPAKSALPKAPIPSLRPAVRPEGSNTSQSDTFEVARAQSELLYLSILHQSADANLHKFEESARRSLSKQFGLSQKEEKKLSSDECVIQEEVNSRALARWGNIGSGAANYDEFAGNIQTLSRCLTELTQFSAPDGRYAGLVAEFEAWFDQAEVVSYARANTAAFAMRDEMFLSPLAQEWHGSHSSISQRLRLSEREVELSPPLPDDETSDTSTAFPSTSERMLGYSKSTVSGTRQELDSMLAIERQISAREKAWVEDAISGSSSSNIVQGVEAQENTSPWHAQSVS